jgi:hypothetical protein
MTAGFDNSIAAPLLVVLWRCGMLLLMEFGRRAGARRLARDPQKGLAGLDVTAGAAFLLFGLLVGFTFSAATSRLEARRQLAVAEANDIGTAFLRLDLLPSESQPALRDLFRRYVDARLAAYGKLPDVAAARQELERSRGLQAEIWSSAVAATRRPGAHPDAAKLVLPALNEMFDITTTRTAAASMHPPRIIYAVLLLTGLGCAFLAGVAGSEARHRGWTHMITAAVLMGVVVYVILGLEYPRSGVLPVPNFDYLLVEARDAMR